MLRVKALTLIDFAPFKGEQRIDFRPEPGVTIVTGSNGRGKTWLLNAIRYALFGHVLGRLDDRRDLTRVANWESTQEQGEARFKVILEFDSDGVSYRLTRSFVSGPSGPREEVLLVRGPSVLTQDETRRELDRVLPEQIARFFLFDGELLRQYEELALDPSRGEDLKAAIERILGIPILVNARTDMAEIAGRVNRALAQVAAANTQTQQLGVSLRAAQDLYDQYKETIATLTVSLDRLESERTGLEEQMARSTRLQVALAKRDGLLQVRERENRELAGAELALRERMGDLWRAMVAPTIEDLRRSLDSDLAVLISRRRAAVEAALALAHRRSAAESGACPTCGQALDHELRVRLASETAESEVDIEEIDTKIQALRNRVSSVTALVGRQGTPTIAALEGRVEDHRVAIADLNIEIAGLQTELQDAPEAELRELAL